MIRLTWSISAMLLVSSPSYVLAVTVVDQEYNPDLSTTNTSANVGAGNQVDWAQTFTVGIAGSLTSVDVLLVKEAVVQAPVLLDIRATTGGTPLVQDTGPHILSSATFDASLVTTSDPNVRDGLEATFVHVDVPDFPVNVGDVLAIVLRSDDPGDDEGRTYQWISNPSPGYGEGEIYGKGAGGWLKLSIITQYDDDFAFRTYVNVVPEPNSAILVLISATCLARRRRFS